jgi:hypothetical protein
MSRAQHYRCDQLGPRDAWRLAVYRGALVPPVCNRAPGHPGKHGFIRADDFEVLAEWTNAEVPAP